MKVAIVIQRYGSNVLGGAEAHARLLAEKLVKDLSWNVDILTTRALDYRTWKNELPSGESIEHGARVFRFSCSRQRSRWIFGVFHRLALFVLPIFQKQHIVVDWIESLWFRLQGPKTPELIAYLKKHEHTYDRIIFFTYLYYPTIFGLTSLQDPTKGILIPTAHDEPALYFKKVKKLFETATWVFANTKSEADLIEKNFGIRSKLKVVGIGFEDLLPKAKSVDAAQLFQRLSISHKSYVLYLGRISKGKGVSLLIASFLSQQDVTVPLVLLGKKESGFLIPDHPLIKYVDFLPEDEKLALIQGALCLVNPSPLESLSLVVLEAISLCVPVLVNGKSEVLLSYAKELPTVFEFYNQDDFTQKLRFLLDGAFPQTFHISKQWLEKNFSWESVLSHFKSLDERV